MGTRIPIVSEAEAKKLMKEREKAAKAAETPKKETEPKVEETEAVETK